MCGEKCPLVSMGGRAEGQACADPGARTPIGASGYFQYKMVNQVHTITNNTQMNIGMVMGFPDYNPILAII